MDTDGNGTEEVVEITEWVFRYCNLVNDSRESSSDTLGEMSSVFVLLPKIMANK